MLTPLVKRARPESRARWHYCQSGQGPNLLLLHGLGASIFSWRHNLDPLGQYFRVMALDLKGCGDSPASVCDDYTLTALVQEVADFMDARSLERTALAGNSLGGSLALLLAQRCPERVSALILLAPAVLLSRLPYIFYPLRLPVVSWLVALLLGPWIMPWALRLAYHDRRLITPEVIAGYARPLRSLQRRLTLRALCQSLHPWPPEQILALLAAIRQPTALIWGEEDRILPPVQAYWLQAYLPQAELHLLPQVGHAPQEEDPLRVNKIIIDFLQRSS
ncbi:MAG: alpha/beta fold hydrolase [Desulfobacca sp.]|nr:alpha/beta fold hydrolase [Desulfobacca sp.]